MRGRDGKGILFGWWRLVAIGTALLAMPALAAKMETLVMPGPLIQGHAKLEAECSQCHRLFDKTAQDTLCRDCHKDITADITQERGFHGRAPQAKDATCRLCHSDHKGRDADIVNLDRETFRHDLTDYPLAGRHAGTGCAACHPAGKRFREAPQQCHDCHSDDDTHRGRLGKQCADCHSERRPWREARFDHDKTDYPLREAHAKVACNACHPNQRYEQTPKACQNCHVVNDIHQGRFGEDCKACHNTREWTKTAFDHDKDTAFKLSGGHRDAHCNACHAQDPFKVKIKSVCVGCHERDDRHQGRNGNDCRDCHDSADWARPRFDHARDTQYPLRGRHARVSCTACHGADVRQPLAGDCHACHAAVDAHQGQLGKDCQRCHNTDGWGEQVFFDHAQTRFPLLGAHGVTACEECHLSAAYRDVSKRCDDCHAGEDVHKRALGDDCGLCHNPNAWGAWLFDHDRQTRFELDGAHRDLVCKACHTRPQQTRKDARAACADCHTGDDIHQGGFGRQCQQCHVTSDFQDVRMDR